MIINKKINMEFHIVRKDLSISKYSIKGHEGLSNNNATLNVLNIITIKNNCSDYLNIIY